MSVECPYCNKEVEICHDDGYGYEEDQTHEDECCSCGNKFVYTTSISFYHEAKKADCLNGGDHIMEKVIHNPVYWPDWVRCKFCGKENKGE